MDVKCGFPSCCEQTPFRQSILFYRTMRQKNNSCFMLNSHYFIYLYTYACVHKFPWLCGACVSLPTPSWHSTVCFLALTPPLAPPMVLCHSLKTWSAPAGLTKTAFFTTARTCPTGASQQISLTSAGEIMKQGKKEENVYFLDHLLIKRVMQEGGALWNGLINVFGASWLI